MTSRFPATFQKYPASFGFSGAVTVTDLLKQAGYRTGHFGKWHIGTETKNGTYGIDVIDVLKGDPGDPRGRDAGIADATIDFIEASKDRPFYVNVWFHTPHNPVRPSRSFVDRFADVTVERSDFPNPDMQRYFDGYQTQIGDVDDGMRNYLGDVLQLDTQVRRILQAIDDQGLRSNTLVVFTSDNGAGGHSPGNGKMSLNLLGSSGPLRERKHSLHDGGTHLPLIVRWPGHVPAGRVDASSVLAGVGLAPDPVRPGRGQDRGGPVRRRERVVRLARGRAGAGERPVLEDLEASLPGRHASRPLEAVSAVSRARAAVRPRHGPGRAPGCGRPASDRGPGTDGLAPALGRETAEDLREGIGRRRLGSSQYSLAHSGEKGPLEDRPLSRAGWLTPDLARRRTRPAAGGSWNPQGRPRQWRRGEAKG